MIYSVYNYGSKRYDYYRTSSPGSTTHAGTPPHRMGSSPLGATPEQIAWSLPSDAVPCGAGDIARGRIATKSTGVLGFLGNVEDVPMTTWIMYAGIAYAAWRVLR